MGTLFFSNRPSAGRHYASDVKRAEELERRIRFLETQLAARHFRLSSGDSVDVEMSELSTLELLESKVSGSGLAVHVFLTCRCLQLEDEEHNLREATIGFDSLKQSKDELLELLAVLRTADELLGASRKEAAARPQEVVVAPSAASAAQRGGVGDRKKGKSGSTYNDDSLKLPLLAAAEEAQANVPAAFGGDSSALSFVAGVINGAQQLRGLERVLWRATRGNMYFRNASSHHDENVFVFIILFQGAAIEGKIRKIAAAFAARLYACPESPVVRATLVVEVTGRIQEMSIILGRSSARLDQMMHRIAERIDGWRERVMRDKAVRHILNYFNFDGGRKCLIGEAWIPSNRVDDLANALRRGNDRSGSNVPSIMQMMDTSECDNLDIPVRMRTNRFTKTFNNIIEAYGVAAYGEVNPAVWSIATFPILFSIMFGDVGHGVMLLIPALLLCVFEGRLKRNKNLGEIFGMMFRARYLLVLMALCSIYMGFLYNEFYALPMWGWRSTWKPTTPPSAYLASTGVAFPFGVDPAWKSSANELQFYNSLKMKLSIIVAYFHMMLGICMHAKNALYFKRPYDFYFEFIPRAVFLTCIIGYMVLLIFWKWLTPWALVQPNPPNMPGNGASAAPYIIGVMISMFLTPLSTKDPGLCQHMLGCPFQTYFEFALLMIALLCIPVMLLAKPLLLRRDAQEGNLHPDFRHHPFEFGELMVHQVIETIEFVLGSISNTASYLRLWALSLAHSELSIVFYEKALGAAMEFAGRSSPFVGGLALVVGFYLWASFTVAVLLGMEALSGFLHTLRLHWVEYMNKFFNHHGSGKKFVPFSLKKIRKEAMSLSVVSSEAPPSKEE